MTAMSLPHFHFPYSLCTNPNRREMFTDFGNHGAVDVAEWSPPFSQKIPINDKETFCARLPSLPLKCQPNEVSYPLVDSVFGKQIADRRLLRAFIKHVAASKRENKLKRKPFHYGSKISMTKAMESGDADDLEDLLMIPWFAASYDTYKSCLDLAEYPIVNTDFTGGCIKPLSGLSAVSSSGAQCHLLSPAGTNFNKLQLLSVTPNSSGSIISELRHETNIDDPVLEVDVQDLGEQHFCAVRTKNACKMYRFDCNDGISSRCVAEENFTDQRPSSIAFSPYISGECVITDNKGSAYLWTPGKRLTSAIESHHHRFACLDPWRSCHYGGHPRLLVMADRTAVELYDIRTCGRNGLDLFALPSKFLQQQERIMTTAAVPGHTFYHLVAADNSLFMVDERFPGIPILQWSHLLTAPPQYLHVIPRITKNSDDSLIMIGSQNLPETCCFQTRFNQQKPPQSIGCQWRLSRIDDFTRYKQTIDTADDYLVSERFATSSLAGVCGIGLPDRDGFVAFQLDSHGDVFYQTYFSSIDESQEKTHASGPGCPSIMTQEGAEISIRWLQGLQRERETANMKRSQLYHCRLVDNAEVFDVMSHEKCRHVLCQFCMPHTSKHYTVGMDPEDDVCRNCNIPISKSHTVSKYIDQDKIIPDTVISLDDFTAQLPNINDVKELSSTSQLYMHLWNENTDIHDLLVAQEKEVMEWKRERQKLKKIAKESKKPIAAPAILDIAALEHLAHGASISDIKREESESDSDEDVSIVDSPERTEAPKSGSVKEDKSSRVRHSSESSVGSRSSLSSIQSSGFFNTPVRIQRMHQSPTKCSINSSRTTLRGSPTSGQLSPPLASHAGFMSPPLASHAGFMSPPRDQTSPSVNYQGGLSYSNDFTFLSPAPVSKVKSLSQRKKKKGFVSGF